MHELEVDAVAVTSDVIVHDVDVPRGPEMNTVTGAVLGGAAGREAVSRDATAFRPREVDAEEGIVHLIVLDAAAAHFADTDGGAVLDVTGGDVAKGHAANQDVVCFNAQDVRGASAVE